MMLDRFSRDQLEGIVAFLMIDAHINLELAAGVRENTQPFASAEARLSRPANSGAPSMPWGRASRRNWRRWRLRE